MNETAIDVIPFQESHVAGARVSPAQKQHQGMLDDPHGFVGGLSAFHDDVLIAIGNAVDVDGGWRCR